MKRAKIISYSFPNPERATSLKIFQDTTSQIRGFYFTKSNIKELEEQSQSTNYAVYFLFEDNSEKPSVYIGQSENGINRIKSHVSNKNFWNYCIMFVTDNNQFDKTCIDYLEWYFINLFKSTVYTLDNSQERIKEPNIDNSFTKPIILDYADQIKFLLEANGIVLTTEGLSDGETHKEVFEASSGNASIYIHDGNFILKAGSIIKRPPDKRSEWSDGGRFYNRFNTKFNELVESKKCQLIDKNSATLLEDIICNSPSYAGALCAGYSTNGWEYWLGLDKVRENM